MNLNLTKLASFQPRLQLQQTAQPSPVKLNLGTSSPKLDAFEQCKDGLLVGSGGCGACGMAHTPDFASSFIDQFLGL